MFLGISPGYRTYAILNRGKIALGLRPRTRSRPQHHPTCEAGPDSGPRVPGLVSPDGPRAGLRPSCLVCPNDPGKPRGPRPPRIRDRRARRTQVACTGLTCGYPKPAINEAAVRRPGPIALEVPIASCRSPDRWLFLVLFDVRSARCLPARSSGTTPTRGMAFSPAMTVARSLCIHRRCPPGQPRCGRGSGWSSGSRRDAGERRRSRSGSLSRRPPSPPPSSRVRSRTR